MSKAYDFTFGLNFASFNESNSSTIYRTISLDDEEENIDVFDYQYKGLFQDNPYISHIDMSSSKAEPLLEFFHDKLDKSNSVPIINLTFNPKNSRGFTSKYLDKVKEELETNLNKFVKILISGHGKFINAIGTGNENLNEGYVVIEEIIDIIKYLMKGCKEKITYLKIYLVSCRANQVGTPKYLYDKMLELSLPFPFCVVGYDNDVGMCKVLNTKHDENIQKFSTFYDNEFEGRKIYRNDFKLQIQKVISLYAQKLPFLLKMYDEAMASQSQRVTFRTINILCSKIIDTIEYCENYEKYMGADQDKLKYYSSLNIIPKTKYYLSSEEIKLSKELI